MEPGNVGPVDSDAEQIVRVTESVTLHKVKDHTNVHITVSHRGPHRLLK